MIEQLIDRHGIWAKFVKMLGGCALGKFMLTPPLVTTFDAQPVHFAYDERVNVSDGFRIHIQRD